MIVFNWEIAGEPYYGDSLWFAPYVLAVILFAGAIFVITYLCWRKLNEKVEKAHGV